MGSMCICPQNYTISVAVSTAGVSGRDHRRRQHASRGCLARHRTHIHDGFIGIRNFADFQRARRQFIHREIRVDARRR